MLGNWIGETTSRLVLANGDGGIVIRQGKKNTIGGPNPGEGNRITSDGPGVSVALRFGEPAKRTSILSNTFRIINPQARTAIGIDLGGDGVTANDFQDPDKGPNKLQNFPTLESARVIAAFAPDLEVKGILNSNQGSIVHDWRVNGDGSVGYAVSLTGTHERTNSERRLQLVTTGFLQEGALALTDGHGQRLDAEVQRSADREVTRITAAVTAQAHPTGVRQLFWRR